MDLSLRRRAVYTGLRPFLTDSELQTALVLWQEKYAGESSYAFTEFLAACCNTDQLKRKRTRILSALLRAMDTPESNLLEDPLNEKTGEMNVYSEDEAILTNNTNSVFMRFFETLLKQCDEKEAAKIKTSVTKNVADLKIDVLSKKYLTEWLDGKSSQLKGNLELALLRQTINFLYISFCEYFGPVKADQLLAQGHAETEAFSIDKSINLHDFL